MKIALAQINVESGKCESNFLKIKTYVEKAKKAGADLIVFPEMCVSGYLLEDQWLNDAFCQSVHAYNERIKALSDGIGIIFGNLYYDELYGVKYGRDGRKARFNVALFASNQEWVAREDGKTPGIHIKHLNPDYRIFDDSRYFLSALEVNDRNQEKEDSLLSCFIWEHNHKVHRIALEVCEDLWSGSYSVDVSEYYAKQNCECIINISSSNWTLQKENARQNCIKEHALNLKDKMPMFVYVNACGMQNTGKNIVLFDGGSCIYDTHGKVLYALNDRFKEELAIFDNHNTRKTTSSEGKLLDALTFALQEVDRQMFRSNIKWIIGLSGGIDSCINAALLVKALGKDRVIGYNMASIYNSSTTKNNAKILAEKLGIPIKEGSIELLHKATLETIKEYGYKDAYPSLVYENIQARIRGHLLSTFASIEGGVVINNANKIEVALGYCTLYGDAIGAFSPLGDLTKVQCFQIAKELNDYFNQEIISNTLIPSILENEIHWEMPPSAELKDAQFDPMKWFYHDYLVQLICEYPCGNIETFMQSYLDQSIYQSDIGKWIRYYHLDNPEAFIEDLEWFLRTLSNAAFKRIQSPPILALSSGAFGNDYRESQLGWIQSERYQILKDKILKSKH